MVDLSHNARYADALERARRNLAQSDLDLLEAKFISLGLGDIESLSPDGASAIRDPNRLRDLGEIITPEGTRHLWEVVGSSSIGADISILDIRCDMN